MNLDPMDRTPKLAVKARLKFDEIEKRHLLVFPEAALALNPTAAEVLKLVDGTRTIREIAKALSAVFSGAPEAQIASEVAELLSRLAERKLVEL